MIHITLAGADAIETRLAGFEARLGPLVAAILARPGAAKRSPAPKHARRTGLRHVLATARARQRAAGGADDARAAALEAAMFEALGP